MSLSTALSIAQSALLATSKQTSVVSRNVADASNPEPYFYMGTILVGQNKVPDAIASLEKYLTMNPQNAQNVATAQGLLQALKPKK